MKKIFLIVFLFIKSTCSGFLLARSGADVATSNWEITSLKYKIPCKITDGSSCIPDSKYWQRILRDEGFVNNPFSQIPPLEISTATETEAWRKDNGAVTEKPIAMVSGCIPRVEASFSFPGSEVCIEGQLYVRASWSGYAVLSPQLCEISDNNSQKAKMKPTYFNASVFSDLVAEYEIRHFPTFELDWEFTNNPLGEWKPAGKTAHPLYFTFDVAQNNYDGSNFFTYGVGAGKPRFLTSIHQGCKTPSVLGWAANLHTIFENSFASLCVKTVGSYDCLGYWTDEASSTPPAGTDFYRGLWALYSNKDARCGEFREMLSDILTIQGFEDLTPSSNIQNDFQLDLVRPYSENGFFGGDYAKFKAKTKEKFGDLFNEFDPNNEDNDVFILSAEDSNSGDVGVYGIFFVKNWNFSEEEAFYTFSADAFGVPAQGHLNVNPEPYFNNHVMIEYDGEIYDPSYGQVFNSRNEWILNSIDGVGGEVIERFGPLIKRHFYLDKKINQYNLNKIVIYYE